MSRYSPFLGSGGLFFIFYSWFIYLYSYIEGDVIVSSCASYLQFLHQAPFFFT